MRLPLVNLVYRHLATFPGVLPWAWAFLRPAMISGAIDAARARIVDAAPLPDLQAIASADLPTDGVALADVVDAYNRGNGLNLVALTLLRLAIDLPTTVGATAPVQVDPVPDVGEMPALTPIQALRRSRSGPRPRGGGGSRPAWRRRHRSHFQLLPASGELAAAAGRRYP